MSKIIKKMLTTIATILIAIIVLVGSYVIYMSLQYYRIEDMKELEVSNESDTLIEINKEYTISTYNIGFGAYSRDFSFFMDTGYLDGKKITGKNAKAKDKNEVLKNTNGAISIIENFNPDIMFFQEVDTKSTRSHKVNQKEMIEDAFKNYSTSYAVNFHSAYLFYPIFDNHGTVNSGILTLNRFKVNSSTRYKLPIDESFPTKFFDLDRCFMMERLPIDGSDKELVLINIHMSAYDKGGVYRKKQLALLNSILKLEKEQGNYVIVGGDFNHDVADSVGHFETKQPKPDWVSVINPEDLESGYRLASSKENPTCRAAEMPYQEGVNYIVTIDGFIISDNVTIESVDNIVSINGTDVNFMYSDHNPVIFKFKLN